MVTAPCPLPWRCRVRRLMPLGADARDRRAVVTRPGYPGHLGALAASPAKRQSDRSRSPEKHGQQAQFYGPTLTFSSAASFAEFRSFSVAPTTAQFTSAPAASGGTHTVTAKIHVAPGASTGVSQR